MNKRKTIGELILRFIDRTLSMEDHEALEDRLRRDPKARRDFESFIRNDAELKGLAKVLRD